ncbi:ATP-grasp fold amidoligase family protein [Neobacillus drentensis]|uniref:ATP-grasp fold amidoligase family protein n=1 Tax=Neobacillus drentensis TaxID=220684 RepID=UPI002FFF5FF3
MLGKLKKLFPGLYEWYRHLLRLKTVKEINKFKKKDDAQRREILSNMYFERIGHTLNWGNLQSYTEKMQWEKMYVRNPMKTKLADKYLVRDWIAEKIGSDYLIPLIGVWDSFKDICFEELPEQFVLKTNHGSGTNVTVKNKSELDKKATKYKFNDWMKMDFAYTTGFEMHYSDIPRKILAEKYLETSLGELQDYKFICFDGKPYFCWVDLGRYGNHTRTVFDLDWNLQPWTQASYGISQEPIPKPKNFDKMVELATVLCQGFSHVRVDFYNVEGVIYFGEMTFTNGSGLDPIVPKEYDYMLGKMWNNN